MKIRAAVTSENATFCIETVELDDTRADEILVEVAGVGASHTDLVFAQGGGTLELTAVLGHEGSGTVSAFGSAITKVAVGDRAAISFRSRVSCDRCESGDPAYCRTMPMLNYTGLREDGVKNINADHGSVSRNFFGQSSFANHTLTYERNVVKLSDDVPLELMGPLGSGVQTGIGGVTRSLDARPGSSILITGGGSVGLSAVVGAAIAGCETILLSEPMAVRQSLARELGATHVFDPTAADLAEAVREICPLGVDFAFDTTGMPTVLESVLACMGSKAVFGIVGIAPPGTGVPGNLMSMMSFGHTAKGLIEGDSNPGEFIPELVKHYKARHLLLEKLVKTHPLADINHAIDDQSRGLCGKPVLIA